MPLATQSRLGPYEVVSLLGSGAMGEVYRARDTRLRRDVAIKIVDMRKSADDDDDRMRRFEQEARNASALNHPNIVTIHDVGREDHLSYIVTELVEGESLRAYLQRRSPVRMREILDIGIQIADGLSAAHDHGIVHRDLKPENIMLTRDGRVKILDFGLAKPAEEQAFSEDDNRTLGGHATAPGVVFGTVPYMSPEQAKGGRVSFYADQFALGVILYEMASGSHPFKRESPLQTLSAILTEDAPLLTQGSPPFQWLVRRCMHREPDHRYASTHDVARELRNIRDHLTESGGIEAIEEPVIEPEAAELPWPVVEPRRRDWVRYALTLVAVLLAGTVGYLLAIWAGGGWGSRSGWMGARFVPFAVSSGLEVFPAWAPSSRSIAYSAEVGGVFQILVRSNGAAMPSQLTRLDQDCFFPFWSPDGSRVYFISEQALWSVGATGGSPQKVLDNVAQAAIAPDGKTLAALRADGSTYSLWTGAIPGYKLKRFDKGAFAMMRVLPWSYLRFSPDGKKLAAWLSLGEGKSEFWLIPMAGDDEPERALSALERLPMAREFTWSANGKEIVYAERSGLSVGSHLWRAEVSSGRITPVTNGAGSELSPSISAAGKELAFSSTHMDYDVVRITLDGKMEDVIATPVFEVSPTVSARGQFAYVTDRSGQPELWLRETEIPFEKPLVTGASFGEEVTNFIFDAAFSPDGSRIAYRRAAANDEAIWISTTTGEPPVRLAKEPGGAIQRSPTWSPDGNSIAYFSVRNGTYVLMKARVGGIEEPVVLAQNAGTHPRWSPKGDWIASIGNEKGVTLVSADGQQRKDLGSGSWLLHGWSADGSMLYGVRRSADRRLELVALRDGAETVLGDMGLYPAAFSYGITLGSLPLRGFAMAADGKGFLTSVIRPKSDIWVMERGR
ncbi:MAG TPA: protein kinase [Bryobacteraceae bacterium]|nr:protein kinase [Bryobacteraceae bacterium]